MISHNDLLHGSDIIPPAPVPLSAGPLTLDFEPHTGWLRQIRFGDHEVIRAIYAAVRDRNWIPIAAAVRDLRIDASASAFRVEFEIECRQREVDFGWRSTIVGHPDGRVRYEMNGRARTTFLKNRIGFCVLHPIKECAGRACTVEKVDAAIELGAFPELISPHLVFKNMRAIAYEFAAGVEAQLRFEGDVFEMEDQRNWTDASFKTYCTPLELPFPTEIQAGSVVEQAVTLCLVSPRHAGGSPAAGSSNRFEGFPPACRGLIEMPSIDVDWFAPGRELPRIGLGVASHGEGLSEHEVTRLKTLRPAHLRVDLDLTGSDWRPRLHQAATQARQLETPLEAALFVSEEAEEELGALAGEFDPLRPPVWAWLVFHKQRPCTPETVLQLAAEHLRRLVPDAMIGSGTNANFAEFNRHPPTGPLDLVCYSINPQVHAFDDFSLLEALEAQGETVRAARHLTGDVPVAVTPVTLKRRFNAVATGFEPGPAPGELPPQVDVRQVSLFGAAWTLGSFKRLIESNVSSVTYYETTGWRGVMETQRGSPLPNCFHSIPGSVFPMYHVFADIGEFRGGHVIPLSSDRPRVVDGLALRERGRSRILLANLTPHAQKVNVALRAVACQVRYLDETNAETAMRAPESYRSTGESIAVRGGFVELDLRSYAVVCIDTEEDGKR